MAQPPKRPRPRCDYCEVLMYRTECRFPGSQSRKAIGWYCGECHHFMPDLNWVPPATPP